MSNKTAHVQINLFIIMHFSLLCSVDCVPLSEWEHALSAYKKNKKDQKILLTNYGEDVCL